MNTEAFNLFSGRVAVDPAICNGKLAIHGKRITVQIFPEYLGADESEGEILRQYPSLQPEDIKTCLQFAASLMDRRYDLQKVA